MDQCIFCSSRGDIKKCENTFCSYHDSWYAETLLAKLEKSEQRVKALEEALRAIADGRGMVPDKSTIYMNGRTPEVPTIFNKHDMQEVAKRALEATCQKK